MTHRVEVSPAATRGLRKMNGGARRRLQAAIELFVKEPRPSGAKKLVGDHGEWRARTGDYRILYEIDDEVLRVLVLAVDRRREIHRAGRRRPNQPSHGAR